ncbi:MAG TPA: hypothetical protein PLO62_00260 [Candidatus Hydrogenedentes bacterium]|nr:hypothetical protein [Candidatus Hydrogenedentota bacterium]HOS01584.1 hypothetical protein [Candidatus Hydrogenedentota bacterium]
MSDQRRSSRMPIETIPDWETRLARQDAFWHRAVLDRPMVCMQWEAPTPNVPPPPPRAHATIRDRWMDVEYLAETARAAVANTVYAGDALPSLFPNLGPTVFSAFFGLEPTFAETTTWTTPAIEDWSRTEHVRFSEQNPYWLKVQEMTRALLEAGKGRFYVGMTDIHPGGDALAAFRGTIELNTDLLLDPEPVKRMLDEVHAVFQHVFQVSNDMLDDAKQACTAWPSIVSSLRWHVPQCDFSCMISKEMFDAFFLDKIRDECRFAEASLYHLDGPNALQHLDSLLEIPELNAVQWIYGAGHGRASDWTHIYKRCQQAGKGIQIVPPIDLDELDWLTTELRPEGVWSAVHVSNADEAEYVLDRIARWK